jgi:hypothetical protein
MSVLNDTPSPFASTGLPDESLMLPGCDDWCDEHELEPDDAEMERWRNEMDRKASTSRIIAVGNIAIMAAVVGKLEVWR